METAIQECLHARAVSDSAADNGTKCDTSEGTRLIEYARDRFEVAKKHLHTIETNLTSRPSEKATALILAMQIEWLRMSHT